MRNRIAARSVALAAVAAGISALGACGNSGDRTGGAGGSSVAPCPGGPEPSATAGASTRPLVAVVQPPNGAAILARFDPLSLEPVSRQVRIAEYHDAWSLSPDRSRVALGMSAPGRRGRVGVLIVDLETMRVVRGIETGVAAEALAWLAPRVLVAGLQRGGAVVADPLTGNVVRRSRELSAPHAAAATSDGLVMLGAGPRSGTNGAVARLAVVDGRAHVRTVDLERVRFRSRFANGVHYADRAGLVVDRGRARAYVFAAAAPVAEVDLRTMQLSYHRLPLGVHARRDVLARVRQALWVGGRRVLVVGRDFVRAGGGSSLPAGALLVDTARWTACVVHARAGGGALAMPRVLVYSGGSRPGIGLRAFTGGGRRTFHVLDGEEVWSVSVGGGRAYAQTPKSLRIVDVSSARVLRTIGSPVELADVIAGAR